MDKIKLEYGFAGYVGEGRDLVNKNIDAKDFILRCFTIRDDDQFYAVRDMIVEQVEDALNNNEEIATAFESMEADEFMNYLEVDEDESISYKAETSNSGYDDGEYEDEDDDDEIEYEDEYGSDSDADDDADAEIVIPMVFDWVKFLNDNGLREVDNYDNEDEE